MVITFWGVRGSLAAPMTTGEYRRKLKEILRQAPVGGFADENAIERFIGDLPGPLQRVVGGNTTCVSVTPEDGTTCILDGGSGLRNLGDRLMKGPAGKGEAEIHIFITHTHWDHICGIPFFKPLYIPGNKVHFYSTLDDLHERLQYQQTERFFPLPFDDMAATKTFTKMTMGVPLEFENDLMVSCRPLKHPSGSTAYRFEDEGRSFVFATDVEFNGEDLEMLSKVERPDDFFHEADLLVMDAQYTLDESFQKFDWGHTSVTMAVNCASRWKIKNLMLTHHEPAYLDKKIYSNLMIALDHRNTLMIDDLKVYLARENTKVTLPPRK